MKEQIRIKIEKIIEYKKILDNMKEDCNDKFLKDPVYRGAILHYLYLIADSCVSLAEMVIRDKGLRTPQSYHEAIDILGENKIMPPDFAYEFANIASFRNLLAHDYEKIDYLKICREVLGKLDDISKYVDYIKENY
ncbi:type VII toxin-antitoxin system HepT family RNase toxin [Dissulfurispira sp.]|uniref:type VII toxin-antitoxin system HepT family RNase toxin n=1 Tax=Dissulfurispira sp. TaxID=2817609 RepID=UPI002FD9E4A3